MTTRAPERQGVDRIEIGPDDGIDAPSLIPRLEIETSNGQSLTLIDVTASEAVVQGLALVDPREPEVLVVIESPGGQRRFRLRTTKPEDVP